MLADGDAWIMTLLDFYGLPEDFPGLAQAVTSPSDPRQKVLAVQQQFAQAINHIRLIPFLALHEFEALLFSAPDIIEAHFDLPQLAARLHQVVQEAGGPELVNHGANTHPKARLQNLISGYKESSDGPMLINKIGLATVRDKCSHFDAWLSRLERLSEQQTGGI